MTGGAAPAFRQSSASAEEIAAHLGRCDDSFTPKLSDRLEIAAYADKIARQAVTFEAWSDDRLVGLVAAYLNNPTRQAGFVTNVSVEPPFMGRGIGAMLLESCLARAKSEDFESLTLDVNEENRRAIRFYEKFGFLVQDTRDDTVTMSLGLGPSRPEALTGGTR